PPRATPGTASAPGYVPSAPCRIPSANRCPRLATARTNNPPPTRPRSKQGSASWLLPPFTVTIGRKERGFKAVFLPLTVGGAGSGSKLARAKGIATAQVAAIEPGFEPSHALRRRAMRKRFGNDVAAR